MMNEENSNLKTDAGADPDKQPASTAGADRSKRLRLWVNWALALLTVLGAAIVMVYFFSAVMSTAGCSARTCQHVGPDWVSPDVLLYGPPVVAVLTIVGPLAPPRPPAAPACAVWRWLKMAKTTSTKISPPIIHSHR